MKNYRLLFFLFSFFVCLGCYQVHSDGEDEDLRTQPTTNNPQIIPSHGSSLLPGNFN